jgi:hypothetical protein
MPRWLYTNGVLHGAFLGALSIGGYFSALLGIGGATQDDVEDSLLRERLRAPALDAESVDIGRSALEEAFWNLAPVPRRARASRDIVLLEGRGAPRKAVHQAREIGQEAHRQILRYKYARWTHEVTLELAPGTYVRKDALRNRASGVEVLIIKPDTPTGRASAEKRASLVERYGYRAKVELYDPLDRAYRPESSTYIGPSSR